MNMLKKADGKGQITGHYNYNTISRKNNW